MPEADDREGATTTAIKVLHKNVFISQFASAMSTSFSFHFFLFLRFCGDIHFTHSRRDISRNGIAIRRRTTHHTPNVPQTVPYSLSSLYFLSFGFVAFWFTFESLVYRSHLNGEQIRSDIEVSNVYQVSRFDLVIGVNGSDD